MARSRNTADTQTASGGPVSPGIAGKNAVINGGFNIWQRGTSVSVAASVTNTYTADRWSMGTGTSQACTVSRQATGDTTNLPFIQYCARVQRNSGQTGTGVIPFVQAIETSNSIPLIGKTITLSFYARAGANYSAASNALGVQAYTGTGTDQNLWSYTGASAFIDSSVTLTTTWQRFSFTATPSSSGTEIGFQFNHTATGTASTNDYFEITGVQLELGSSATPFSRAGGTIQGELAACQRYYWRATAGSVYTAFSMGYARNASVAFGTIQFPVVMRVPPTSLDFSTISFLNYAGTFYAMSSVSIDSNQNSTLSANINGTVSGATTGHVGNITANGSTSAYIGFSAEL